MHIIVKETLNILLINSAWKINIQEYMYNWKTVKKNHLVHICMERCWMKKLGKHARKLMFWWNMRDNNESFKNLGLNEVAIYFFMFASFMRKGILGWLNRRMIIAEHKKKAWVWKGLHFSYDALIINLRTDID